MLLVDPFNAIFEISFVPSLSLIREFMAAISLDLFVAPAINNGASVAAITQFTPIPQNFSTKSNLE